METSSPLNDLKRQQQAVLDYERARVARRGPRTARELRPHVTMLNRHLAQWQALAQAEGSKAESPLLPLQEEWNAIMGVPVEQTQAKPAPAKTKPKGKTQAKAKPEKKPAPIKKVEQETSKSGAVAQASDAAPSSLPTDPTGEEGAEGTDEQTTKILGPGDWLESHAKIIREAIPKVKATAADPDGYLKAKKAFLKSYMVQLNAYCKKPQKMHSPLFAYCVLFLSDTVQTEKAIALAEKAVELQQTSPIKRSYHELLFDVRLAQLEREALEVVKEEKGPRFDAFTALRTQLMNDPFRGNFAKAKVSKIYAQACMALGDYQTAQQNLQQVRFLDPNAGVETMLATCEAKLAG